MSDSHQFRNALCERYARAFLELAGEHKAIEACARDMGSLSAALENSAELRAAVCNPTYGREALQLVFDDIGDKIGAHDLSRKFLSLLIERRRLSVLSDIIGAFLRELAAMRGEVFAEVITATDLTKDRHTRLHALLSDSISKNLIMECRTDSSLIGGFIVRVGSKMIDLSTRFRLLQLSRTMKG